MAFELSRSQVPDEFRSAKLKLTCIEGAVDNSCDGDIYMVAGLNWDESSGNTITAAQIAEQLSNAEAQGLSPISPSCEVCTDYACLVEEQEDQIPGATLDDEEPVVVSSLSGAVGKSPYAIMGSDGVIRMSWFDSNGPRYGEIADPDAASPSVSGIKSWPRATASRSWIETHWYGPRFTYDPSDSGKVYIFWDESAYPSESATEFERYMSYGDNNGQSYKVQNPNGIGGFRVPAVLGSKLMLAFTMHELGPNPPVGHNMEYLLANKNSVVSELSSGAPVVAATQANVDHKYVDMAYLDIGNNIGYLVSSNPAHFVSLRRLNNGQITGSQLNFGMPSGDGLAFSSSPVITPDGIVEVYYIKSSDWGEDTFCEGYHVGDGIKKVVITDGETPTASLETEVVDFAGANLYCTFGVKAAYDASGNRYIAYAYGDKSGAAPKLKYYVKINDNEPLLISETSMSSQAPESLVDFSIMGSESEAAAYLVFNTAGTDSALRFARIPADATTVQGDTGIVPEMVPRGWLTCTWDAMAQVQELVDQLGWVDDDGLGDNQLFEPAEIDPNNAVNPGDISGRARDPQNPIDLGDDDNGNDNPLNPLNPVDPDDHVDPELGDRKVNITFILVAAADDTNSVFHDSETGGTATGPSFTLEGTTAHGAGEAVDALSVATCEAEDYDQGTAPTVSDSGNLLVITFENGYEVTWNKENEKGIVKVRDQNGVVMREGEGSLEIKKLRFAHNGVVDEHYVHTLWKPSYLGNRIEGNSIVIEYEVSIHPNHGNVPPDYAGWLSQAEIDTPIKIETKLTPYTKDIAGTEFKGIGEKHTIIETSMVVNEAHVYTQYFGEGLNSYDLWFTYFHPAGSWNHIHEPFFPLLMTQEGIAFMYQNFNYNNPGLPEFGDGHRVCYPSVLKYPAWIQGNSYDDSPRHFTYEMKNVMGLQTGTIELPEIICIHGQSDEQHGNMWFKVNQYFYDYYHSCYGLTSAMPESMYDAQADVQKTKTNAELLNVDAIMVPQSSLWCGDQMELCDAAGVESLAQWAHDNGKKIYIWFNPAGLDVVWRNNEVKYPEWNIMGEGNIPMQYLGFMTGWYDFSIEKLVALSRGVKGDTGIDGIFLDSAANMGGESIDYNTGMPNLPYMISWISELNANGILVLTEQPTPYGNFGGMISGTLNGDGDNEFYGAYGLTVGDPGNDILLPDGSENLGCLIGIGDTPHPPQGRTKYMGPDRVGVCLTSDQEDVDAVQVENPGLVSEPDTVFLARENAAYARLRAAVHDARPSYLVPEGSSVRWVYNNVEALDGTIINGEILWDSSDNLQFTGIAEVN
ncbi:MAG: hypothetical protein V1659_02730 [Candidatus Woesearchaeota archaeon]